MDLEDFKSIPEFPEYLINKQGLVYSTKSNKLLKITNNSKGYPRIVVCYDNISTHLLLHRVLARVFKDLPSLNSKLEVDHIDNNKLNYSLDNLQTLNPEDHTRKSMVERGFIKHEKAFCLDCGKKVSKPTVLRCNSCHHRRLTEASKHITIEAIEYWVSNFSWARAAKELGMSDNGLRNRYKKLTGKLPSTIRKVNN